MTDNFFLVYNFFIVRTKYLWLVMERRIQFPSGVPGNQENSKLRMNMELKDKTIIITGASQGLGKELSYQVARLGATVALVARQEKLLQTVKEHITSEGGKAEYFVCDVSDAAQVKETVRKVIEKFGTVDILVNNAGVWISNTIATNDVSRIKQAFEINSLGPIYFSESLIPQFEKQQSGHLVFINSVAGLAYPENKNWSVYTATKWAITGYAKSLASRFNNTSNIKVTSIHPGPMTTDIAKNAGDNFGDDHSSEMNTAEVAHYIIEAITASRKIQVDTIELKMTNWNI